MAMASPPTWTVKSAKNAIASARVKPLHYDTGPRVDLFVARVSGFLVVGARGV